MKVATPKLLRTKDDLSRYSKDLKAALKKESRPRFAFDWETNISDDRFLRTGVLLSLYHPATGSASIPLGFTNPDGPQLKYEEAWEIADPLFTSVDIGRVAQNGVFDMQVCRLHGLEVAYSELDFDTLHASWLVDPDAAHDLDTLGQTYGTKHKKLWPSIKALLRHYKVKQTCEAPVFPLAEYAEGDCVTTYELVRPLTYELEKFQLLGNMTEEMRYRKMFDQMSWEGATVDLKRVGELHKQYQKRLVAVEKRIYAKAGEPFNIASTAQLRTILVGKLGLKPLGRNGRVKMTKGGKSGDRKISVDEEVIEVMATSGVPIAKDILEYRTCAKLDGTYLEPYLTLAARDGRIHANFNQCGTGTGRPSSSSPNLQNLPRPDTDFGSEGMALRSVFVPPKGYGMVAGDYSQIELRLMAHFCEDPVMLKIFRDGGDIHTETAEACSVGRHQAKIINFGIVYGMREVALSMQLNCDVPTASTFLARYNQRFRSVAFFRRQMVLLARRFGHVRTLAGRIRRIHDINSVVEWERRHAENQAVNTPIQGSAADMIKRAQYEFVTHVAPKLDAVVALQIHDELVVYGPKKNMKKVTAELKSCMIDSAKLIVPVLVSVASGPSWDKCK